MEKKLEVNIKAIAVIAIIFITIFVVLKLPSLNLENKFGLTRQEEEFIEAEKNGFIDVSYKENYILNKDFFDAISQYLKEDLGLNISFRSKSDVEDLHKLDIFEYPYYIYGTTENYQYGLDYFNNSKIGITDLEVKENFLELYPDLNIEFIIYTNHLDMYKALYNKKIAYIISEYRGNVILPNNLYPLFEFPDYFAKNSVFLKDEDELLTSIIKKTFSQYEQNGIIDESISNTNLKQLKENISSIFTLDETDYLVEKGKITVGLEELPPICYNLNSNVYGLVVAYFKHLAEIFSIEVEYIIGKEEVLTEMFENNEIDYLYVRNDKLNYTKSKAIYKSNLLISSNTDAEVFTNEFNFNDINLYYYGQDSIVDYFNKHSPIRIETLEELSQVYNSVNSNYIVMTTSSYNFMHLVKDMNSLEVNLITNYEVDYNIYSSNDVLVDILNKSIDHSQNKRLYNNTLDSIPRDVVRRQNTLIILSITGIILLILIIYFIIRLILNINEKQRLNYLFIHDQLTYLLNKYGLKKLFNNYITSKKSGVLLLLDIRNLKQLNDKNGVDFGDQILIGLGAIFNSISKSMKVARVGADKFAFLEFETLDDEAMVNKVLECFLSYVKKDENAKSLTANMSSVLFPEFTSDFDTLIKYGESALEHSKLSSTKNNWVRFNDEIYKKFLYEQEMYNDILKAFDKEEFLLYYQPQIALQTEKSIGAEVLIRWIHPERGFVYPDVFLGVAERHGLMRNLDLYMIKKACEQIKIWQNEGLDRMKISVNMTTSTFDSKDIVKDVLKIVNETQIDTSWFTLEITEESGLENLEKAQSVMKDIKEAGIKFALDDFGTGYSSLSYLEMLPFDFLKIDKAFVDHIHTSKKSKNLYNLITRLANLFNMKIIAEGVEYKEQIDIIKKDMDTIIQGYYYSKPLPVNEYEIKIQNEREVKQ